MTYSHLALCRRQIDKVDKPVHTCANVLAEARGWVCRVCRLCRSVDGVGGALLVSGPPPVKALLPNPTTKGNSNRVDAVDNKTWKSPVLSPKQGVVR